MYRHNCGKAEFQSITTRSPQPPPPPLTHTSTQTHPSPSRIADCVPTSGVVCYSQLSYVLENCAKVMPEIPNYAPHFRNDAYKLRRFCTYRRARKDMNRVSSPTQTSPRGLVRAKSILLCLAKTRIEGTYYLSLIYFCIPCRKYSIFT